VTDDPWKDFQKRMDADLETERLRRNERTDHAVEVALADLSKVPTLTAGAYVVGQEPSCPKCGHRNAMITRKWVAHPRRPGNLVGLLICRDCNHAALDKDLR
jgi:hypothetical protein